MTQLKCPKCDYDWDYTGQMQTATCPSCKGNVKVEEHALQR
jgi:predicted Zn-ribbon and HTH transcriptional regulator